MSALLDRYLFVVLFLPAEGNEGSAADDADYTDRDRKFISDAAGVRELHVREVDGDVACAVEYIWSVALDIAIRSL